MSRFILLRLIAVVGTVGCGADRQPADSQVAEYSSGVVLLGSSIHDFGKVDPAGVEQLSHVFVLGNTGVDEAAISEVETSCGCLVVDYGDGLIKSGQEAKLMVAMNTAIEPGVFEKPFTVHFEGSPREPMVLRLRGELLATTRTFAIPKEVDFGTTTPGDGSHERVVRISRYDGSAVQLGRLQTGVVGVTASVVRGNGTSDVFVRLVADPHVLQRGRTQSVLRAYSPSGKEEAKLPLRVFNQRADNGLVAGVFVRNLAPGGSEVLSLCREAGSVSTIEEVVLSCDSEVGLSVHLGDDGMFRLSRSSGRNTLKPQLIQGSLRVRMTESNEEHLIPLKVLVVP